jgi:predicted GIY-YIG superfamily endonuclease
VSSGERKRNRLNPATSSYFYRPMYYVYILKHASEADIYIGFSTDCALE